MTDPNTTRMDMERKLATVKTLDELDGFERGLLMQGYDPKVAGWIVAPRRVELEAGR